MFVNVTCYVLSMNVICYVIFLNVTSYVLSINLTCYVMFVKRYIYKNSKLHLQTEQFTFTNRTS
jgi:hypothetical protein